MKTKNSRTIGLLVLVVLLCGTASAQKTGFYWYELNEHSNRLNSKLTGTVYYANYTANEFHFFHDNWVDASLHLIDGDVVEPIKLKYLAYGDQIIAFNQNVGTLFKIEKAIVKGFEYRDTKTGANVRFMKLCADSLFNGCRFMEELYTGHSTLLAFHYVESVKVHLYKDKLGVMRDREFRFYTSYYVQNENGELMRLNRTKRSLIKSYPEHRKEIRKLLRQSKVHIFNQNTFVGAFVLIDRAGLTE